MTIRKLTDMDEFLWVLSSTESSRLIKKGSCRVIRPVVDNLAHKHKDVTFVEVDVEEAHDIAVDVGIISTPTFHFYKGTEKMDGFSGADEDRLKALTEKYEKGDF
ncbi:Thioredoxin domain-containing protein 2 [Mortierella claussenii]|nr:Thioredoxin domain-containing protein 2 [Mortierella claussenii]